tara:strand:- start:310 stop:624 length:315 start_codon:yes stop_codon:yes gene_type:complete
MIALLKMRQEESIDPKSNDVFDETVPNPKNIQSNDDLRSEAKSPIHDAKWLNNYGEEVNEVFGFNANSELVNGRAAMFGFLMLIITEIIFKGEPVVKSIFGIHK